MNVLIHAAGGFVCTPVGAPGRILAVKLHYFTAHWKTSVSQYTIPSTMPCRQNSSSFPTTGPAGSLESATWCMGAEICSCWISPTGGEPGLAALRSLSFEGCGKVWRDSDSDFDRESLLSCSDGRVFADSEWWWKALSHQDRLGPSHCSSK